MASNQTSNYGLNQWEAQDKVLREEFNRDNEKIDAALGSIQQSLQAVAATVPRIVCGTYTGDGAERRVIPLPFTPKAVFLISQHGQIADVIGNAQYHGGLALPDAPVTTATLNAEVLKVVNNGFQVGAYTASSNWNVYVYSNSEHMVYYYLALA